LRSQKDKGPTSTPPPPLQRGKGRRTRLTFCPQLTQKHFAGRKIECGQEAIWISALPQIHVCKSIAVRQSFGCGGPSVLASAPLGLLKKLRKCAKSAEYQTILKEYFILVEKKILSVKLKTEY